MRHVVTAADMTAEREAYPFHAGWHQPSMHRLARAFAMSKPRGDLTQWRSDVDHIADAIKEYNPRFMRAKFVMMCNQP